MKVVIYHNPRCGKSRQTLELLQEQGVEPEIVEYLKKPPTKHELKKILKMLGLKPRALLRTKEKEYRQAGLEREDVSEETIIEVMVNYPILIERPIVVVDGKAALGRPPENVLKLLDQT